MSIAKLTTPNGWTITPPPVIENREDPVVLLLAGAGEALRAIGHSREPAEQPGDLYDRIAELADVLGKCSQVATWLAQDARRMAGRNDLVNGDGSPATPRPEGSRADPRALMDVCASKLDVVARDADQACAVAQAGQSMITWVGVRS